MVWPLVAATAIGGVAGAAGGFFGSSAQKRRMLRYTRDARAEYQRLFEDVTRLRQQSLASSRQETGQAVRTLQGMEREQLMQAGKTFEGERTRAGDALRQMTAQNRSAMAGAGLAGSSIDSGLARQAAAEGARQYQMLSGQEAALRTGILGASRGAQAQIYASRPETQVNQAFAEAQLGARQSHLGFLQSLIFNQPPNPTMSAINSGLMGAGAGMQALGTYNMYKNWEPGWVSSNHKVF